MFSFYLWIKNTHQQIACQISDADFDVTVDLIRLAKLIKIKYDKNCDSKEKIFKNCIQSLKGALKN